MIHSIEDMLPWLLSCVTIVTMILAGDVHRYTWIVAIIGQVLWASWIMMSENYGLLPGHLALWVVYVRNLMKWMNDV